jgi:hypothetical protein
MSATAIPKATRRRTKGAAFIWSGIHRLGWPSVSIDGDGMSVGGLAQRP